MRQRWRPNGRSIMNGMKQYGIGLPMCARCHRPVTCVHETNGPDHSRSLYIIACCHGETDVVEVPDIVVEAFKGGGAGFTFGVAFKRYELPEGTKQLHGAIDEEGTHALVVDLKSPKELG